MQQRLDWNHYLALATQTVAEGIVMLQNHADALPLPMDETVAVFGRMQMHYYKSGTGSGGMVNVTKVTTILDGLIEAGIHVYQPLLETYQQWDVANPYDLGAGWGGEPWSQKEMPLDDTLAMNAAAHCHRAIVIIGRTAGEEQDNRKEQGSFLLTTDEYRMLQICRKHFRKLIVLFNTGNIMDLSWMDTIEPDAVLLCWQGGMTGGTGTAQVLTGKVNPCSKLPDTIAYKLSDYPSDAYFHGKSSNTYVEDIYVGYRYFQTFAPECVRYPFGYGLSYTQFRVSCGQAYIENSQTKLPVTVTNIGTCAGKEVIQIYCEPPQGKLGQPTRILTAFQKTRCLEPNESETLHLSIVCPSSYDDSGVTGYPFAWVQEAGCYRFYAGTDVASATLAAEVKLDTLIVCQQVRQAMAPVEAFQRFKPHANETGYELQMEDVPLLQFDEAQRQLDARPAPLPVTQTAVTLKDVYQGKATLSELVSQLSDETLTQIVRGEGMGSPRVTAGTASAFGGVSPTLEALAIPAGCCSDGPSGMRLDCGTKAFSLPNGTMIAATFNTKLARELFVCMGLEMCANHVDCLLGPGINIHRHPLNGRNFEYFSEDPYLTGQMASAILQGMHQVGVTGTIKHCCGNNQETNRHFLNSVVSERALREIYLKGFEIAVREGKADSIMTTYGAVNGIWTAGSYDLCTEIIRNEWGFKGFLMTDWWANINERGQAPDKSDLAAMIRAQNDVYMVCADCVEHDDNMMEALQNGTLTRGELQRCAMNICGFLLKTHAMKRLMQEDEGVEIINRPAEELPSDEPVVFHDLSDQLTIPLHEIRTEKGTSYAFALTIQQPGWYEVTLTASSTQSILAQVPVTLFCTGTACGTFTWNGTNGEPVSFSKTLPLFSHYSIMRLYFAQSGLNMEQIQIKLVSDSFDITAHAEKPTV